MDKSDASVIWAVSVESVINSLAELLVSVRDYVSVGCSLISGFSSDMLRVI